MIAVIITIVMGTIYRYWLAIRNNKAWFLGFVRATTVTADTTICGCSCGDTYESYEEKPHYYIFCVRLHNPS